MKCFLKREDLYCSYDSTSFSSPRDFKSLYLPTEGANCRWFIFCNDRLLTSLDNAGLPNQPLLNFQRTIFIGTLQDQCCFAAEAPKETNAPLGWIWNPLRQLYGILRDEDFAVAGRALQLIDWDRSHTYCGCCGNLTFHRQNERCRECSTCGHLAYPKIAPAILALIKKGNKILLARNANFPEKFYTILAGFVEPGETLEQAVAREVYEEVGIFVKISAILVASPGPFLKV